MPRRNFEVTEAFETTSSVAFFVDCRNVQSHTAPLGLVVNLQPRAASPDDADDGDVVLGAAIKNTTDGAIGEALYLWRDRQMDPVARMGHPTTESADDASEFTSISQRVERRREKLNNPKAPVGFHPDPLLDQKPCVFEEDKEPWRKDPLLQELYTSQRRTRDESAVFQQRQLSSLPAVTRRQAVHDRVEELVLRKSREMLVLPLPRPADEAATTAVRQNANLVSSQRQAGGLRNDVCAEAPMQKGVAACEETRSIKLWPPPSHTVVSTADRHALSIKERWKLLSTHYKRVSERLSPSRLLRSATRGADNTAAATMKPTVPLPVNADIYDGYYSPVAAFYQSHRDA